MCSCSFSLLVFETSHCEKGEGAMVEGGEIFLAPSTQYSFDITPHTANMKSRNVHFWKPAEGRKNVKICRVHTFMVALKFGFCLS